VLRKYESPEKCARLPTEESSTETMLLRGRSGVRFPNESGGSSNVGLNLATHLQITLGLISSGSVTVKFVNACLLLV